MSNGIGLPRQPVGPKPPQAEDRKQPGYFHSPAGFGLSLGLPQMLSTLRPSPEAAEPLGRIGRQFLTKLHPAWQTQTNRKPAKHEATISQFACRAALVLPIRATAGYASLGEGAFCFLNICIFGQRHRSETLTENERLQFFRNLNSAAPRPCAGKRYRTMQTALIYGWGGGGRF